MEMSKVGSEDIMRWTSITTFLKSSFSSSWKSNRKSTSLLHDNLDSELKSCECRGCPRHSPCLIYFICLLPPTPPIYHVPSLCAILLRSNVRMCVCLFANVPLPPMYITDDRIPRWGWGWWVWLLQKPVQ